MDSTTWIWVVVAIVAVIVIVAVVAIVIKRRNAQKVEQDKENRVKAESLRESASRAGLDAREKHAAAARVEAEAEQAAVQAERMRLEAEQQHLAAAKDDSRSEEKLAQAAKIDPDSDPSRSSGAPTRAKHSGATEADTSAHHDAPGHPPLENGQQDALPSENEFDKKEEHHPQRGDQA